MRPAYLGVSSLIVQGMPWTSSGSNYTCRILTPAENCGIHQSAMFPLIPSGVASQPRSHPAAGLGGHNYQQRPQSASPVVSSQPWRTPIPQRQSGVQIRTTPGLQAIQQRPPSTNSIVPSHLQSTVKPVVERNRTPPASPVFSSQLRNTSGS